MKRDKIDGIFKIKMNNEDSGIMKILFLSGREPAYVRNALIYKGFQKNGAEIHDCTASSTTYLSRYIAVINKLILRIIK